MLNDIIVLFDNLTTVTLEVKYKAIREAKGKKNKDVKTQTNYSKIACKDKCRQYIR